MSMLLSLLISGIVLGAQSRTVYVSEQAMEPIRLTPGRSTILTFPAHPTKVVLGSDGIFSVQYIEADLAISALRTPARSNLFVYLEGRRFGFDLSTVSEGGDQIVFVKDTYEKKIKVKVRNE